MGPSAVGLLQSLSSLMCLVVNCVCTMEMCRAHSHTLGSLYLQRTADLQQVAFLPHLES